MSKSDYTLDYDDDLSFNDPVEAWLVANEIIKEIKYGNPQATVPNIKVIKREYKLDDNKNEYMVTITVKEVKGY